MLDGRSAREKGEYMKKTLSIVLLVSLLSSCAILPKKNIQDIHFALNAKNYTFDLSQSIDNRINTTPDFLIDYLNKIDNVSSYSKYSPSQEDRRVLEKYYQLLPSKYKELLSKKLIGVFFVNSFMGGGMTEIVYMDNIPFVIVVLNPKILSETLSEWMTYRDSSPYYKSDKIKMRSVCTSNDKAVLHTMLHETSHIYDFYNEISGGFVEKKVKRYTFSADVWKDAHHPIIDYDFENRKIIKLYVSGEKLNMSEAIIEYQKLKDTPFASIYGTQNIVEDFAEAFTWYYMKEKLNIDYKVEIDYENSKQIIFRPYANDLNVKRIEIMKTIIE